MKITTERTGNCEVALTVEAEAGEMEESLSQAYQGLVQRVSVPGFRKGKAPKAILEQHIGKSSLLEKALEGMIPRLYREAIESEKIEPVDEAKIEITQTEPLIFKAIVPLKPEVELGDYHNIKIDFEPIEVTEEETEAALEQIRHEQAIWTPVDRAIRFGDLATIDIEASVEGKPFLKHKDLLYEVNEGSAAPLPGVAENLVGAEKNEVRAFTTDIPADYPIDEFAGKKCSFEIIPTEIKEKELPELDDELAQSLGHDNLVVMKEKVADALRARAEERNRLELRGKALDAVVELSQVHYPAIWEEREIEGLIGDEAGRLGFREIEDYLRITNKTREQYQERLRPIARVRINRSLVLDRVAEQEKVEIDAKEVDNRIAQIVENAQDKERAQQFSIMPQMRQSVEQSLRNEKVLEMLEQIVSSDVEEKTKED